MKPLEKPLGFASRPIKDGKVVRTAKGRKFEPKRSGDMVRRADDRYERDLEQAEVTYSDSGERFVSYKPRKKTTRRVKWGKKYYSVPKGLCGEPCDIG